MKVQEEGKKLLETHYQTQFDLDRNALRRKIMPKKEKGPVLWKDLIPFEKAALYRLLHSSQEGGSRYAINDEEWNFLRETMPRQLPRKEVEEEAKDYEIYTSALAGMGLSTSEESEKAYQERLRRGTEEAKERMRAQGEPIEGEKPR